MIPSAPPFRKMSRPIIRYTSHIGGLVSACFDVGQRATPDARARRSRQSQSPGECGLAGQVAAALPRRKSQLEWRCCSTPTHAKYAQVQARSQQATGLFCSDGLIFPAVSTVGGPFCFNSRRRSHASMKLGLAASSTSQTTNCGPSTFSNHSADRLRYSPCRELKV